MLEIVGGGKHIEVVGIHHFIQSRNLYQKKKTMNKTDKPAPIATQEVALSDVASFRNCADWAAKLFDFDSNSMNKKDNSTLSTYQIGHNSPIF